MKWFSQEGSLTALREECGSPDFFPTEDELLFGEWDEYGYEGSFYLVWKRDGRLYEQHLSHCSCNGYSDDVDSWDARLEVTGEYLAKRRAPCATPEMQVAWDALLMEHSP